MHTWEIVTPSGQPIATVEAERVTQATDRSFTFEGEDWSPVAFAPAGSIIIRRGPLPALPPLTFADILHWLRENPITLAGYQRVSAACRLLDFDEDHEPPPRPVSHLDPMDGLPFAHGCGEQAYVEVGPTPTEDAYGAESPAAPAAD